MIAKNKQEITQEMIDKIISMIEEGYSFRYAVAVITGSASENKLRQIKELYPEMIAFFQKHKKKKRSFR